MPDFHAYVSTPIARMLRDILRARPDESLSGIFAQAVRIRWGQLHHCNHPVARCEVCGVEIEPGVRTP